MTWLVVTLSSYRVESGSARRPALKGWEMTIVNPTSTGIVSNETLGELLRVGWSSYGPFQVHRYHLELNWTCMVLDLLCFWFLPWSWQLPPVPWFWLDSVWCPASSHTPANKHQTLFPPLRNVAETPCHRQNEAGFVTKSSLAVC